MAWYVIYDTASGQLKSESDTEIAPQADMTIVQLADRPADNMMWDAATRTFVARPPKVQVDRLDDLLTSNHPAIAAFRQRVYTPASAADKAIISDFLIFMLGRRRTRNQNDPLELD